MPGTDAESVLAQSYRRLFQHSNVPMWQVDYTGVGVALEKLGLVTPALVRRAAMRDPEVLTEPFAKLEIPLANGAALALVGAADQDDLNRKLPTLLRTANRDAILEMVTSYLEGGSRLDFTLTMRRADGRLIVLELRWVVAPQFRVREQSLTTARDRSGHEQIMRELADTDARYRQVVDDMTEFVVRYTKGGVRTFVNRAYAEHFGASPSELIGTSFLDLVEPESRKAVQDKIESLVPGGPAMVDEHEVLLPDGSTGWHQWVDRAVELEDGRVEYQSVGRDVTARVRAEQRLREAYEEIKTLEQALQAENRYLRYQVDGDAEPRPIGESEAWQGCMDEVLRVAPTQSTVLIHGETGSGKERIARTIHAASPRAGQAFVTVNCAALPESLLESELFGHVRGAFTGATRDRKGRFAQADRGTLFLDEVGELSLSTQAKLLRVLQESEFSPVGSDETRRVDVRVLAATNRDLDAAIEAGEFRSDLFYRLNVFPVRVPPLRSRRDDIPRLAAHFVERKAPIIGRAAPSLSDEAIEALTHHDWPGNVRELENVIESALIRCDGDTLTPAHLGTLKAVNTPAETATLVEAERRHIRAVLEACEWKIKGPGNAAERLGLSPSTLRDKMRRLRIERPRSA